MPTDRLVSAREHAVLASIYQQTYATAADVRAAVLPTLSQRSVYSVIEELVRDGFLAGDRLYPEAGARSPCVYHLLQKGARALGLPRLGTHHYRPPTRLTYAYRKALVVLDRLTAQAGGQLVQDEPAARAALVAVLAAAAGHQHGELGAAHLYSGFLPPQVGPDVVLVLPHVTAIGLVAAPHASRAFWRGRLEKYHDLLVYAAVPMVGVALSPAQEADVRREVTRARCTTRVMIATVDTLERALTQLTPALAMPRMVHEQAAHGPPPRVQVKSEAGAGEWRDIAHT